MGFSLVELAVVLCVLGLLIAAGFPAMSGLMRSSRLAGVTNTLTADIHQTRSLATMQRKSYQITFDTDRYSISPVGSPSTVRTRAMPRGVSCTATDTAMFFAWGLTAPVDIAISDGGASKTVRLSVNGSVSHD
jgi:Tfp pilus assembly protein FimT